MKRFLNFVLLLLSFSLTAAAFNETKPKVSVIVPVYNVEPWLRECMESLVNQTLKDIEIICIDDGSLDNSGTILDEYAKKDDRIIVVHQKNAGVQKARNAGLDMAKGEYIAFVDPDDYLELNTYEIAYKYAKKDNVDVIHFEHRMFDDGKDSHKNDLDLSDGLVVSLKEYWDKTYGVYVWENLFKANIIQKDNVRFVPGIRPADDTCFTYSVMGRAKAIKSIPATYYNYRIRAGALSKMTFDDIFINSYKMLKEVCDSWRKGNCIKGQESILLFVLIRWASQYHDISLDYAQEILDYFGDDVYNDKVVEQCPKEIQNEINCLKIAAKCGKKVPLKSGIYKIVSCLDENKCVDINNASDENEAKVQLWDSNSTDAQKFKIRRHNDGYYTIEAVCSGKMVDVKLASRDFGTEIWQYEKNKTAAQKWYIISCGNKCFKVISRCNFLAMDVSGAKTKNGTNIQCWEDNDTDAQKFKFLKVG